jgi:hypothetical protein
LLEGGGFSEIETAELEVVLEYDSPEDFTDFIREIAPPISALIAAGPSEKEGEAWNAITEAVRDASDADQVRFSNQVLVAAGRA